MKYEIVEFMEKAIKDRETFNGKPETAWSSLVGKGIFSRGVPIPRENRREYEEDWSKILDHQVNYLKEFVASSIGFSLGIPPLNEEGSIIAMAVYNAAINNSIIDEGILCIPSTYDIYQEFERLLMEEVDA